MNIDQKQRCFEYAVSLVLLMALALIAGAGLGLHGLLPYGACCTDTAHGTVVAAQVTPSAGVEDRLTNGDRCELCELLAQFNAGADEAPAVSRLVPVWIRRGSVRGASLFEPVLLWRSPRGPPRHLG